MLGTNLFIRQLIFIYKTISIKQWIFIKHQYLFVRQLILIRKSIFIYKVINISILLVWDEFMHLVVLLFLLIYFVMFDGLRND